MAAIRHVLKDLDREWAELVGSAGTACRLRRWQLAEPVLAGQSLEEVVEAVRRGHDERSQELTWALLALAADDALAVRVLLQAIVPGLCGELQWLLSWARRTDPRLVLDGDVDQLLIASALEAIVHSAGCREPWPLSRILRRTHRVLRRETGREDRWQRGVVLADSERLTVAGGEPTTGEVLTQLVREACRSGVVSREDAALVLLTRVGGYAPVEIAERFGSNDDTLRRRRHRAESRLAAWAQAV